MKVAPVDRYGSWRPGGSDARAVSSSRLQTVTPETTPQAAQPALSSGRELPVVPVKQGSNAQLRTVRESDRPTGIDPALNAFQEFSPAAAATSLPTSASNPSPRTTVEAFANPANAALLADNTGLASAATAVASGSPSQPGGAASTASPVNSTTGQAPNAKREDRVAAQRLAKPDATTGQPVKSATTTSPAAPTATATATASDVARQQAAEQARKQPPKEPIAKFLMDQMQALWAASRSVVDASTPVPKPGAPLDVVEKAATKKSTATATAAMTAVTEANAANATTRAEAATAAAASTDKAPRSKGSQTSSR